MWTAPRSLRVGSPTLAISMLALLSAELVPVSVASADHSPRAHASCRTSRHRPPRARHRRHRRMSGWGTGGRHGVFMARANVFGAGMFGVAAGGALQNEGSSTLGRDLAADAGAGARWVRVDINWAQIQNGGASSFQ